MKIYLSICRRFGSVPFIELKTDDAEYISLRAADSVRALEHMKKLGLNYFPTNKMHDGQWRIKQ